MPLTTGRRVVRSAVVGTDGRVAVIATDRHDGAGGPRAVTPAAGKPDAPRELKALSHQNDAWLAGMQLGAVEDFDFTSPDGTKVGAILVKPAATRRARATR